MSAAASVDLVDANGALSDGLVSRAVGQELRRVRENLGWSRGDLVSRLPSGIGDRTLLSYEHGTRQLTVVRLIEIGRVVNIDGPTLLRRGLQRARVHVEKLTLTVDLKALVKDHSETYRPMVQWARNALNEHPDGVAHLEPGEVRHLALFAGCPKKDLANYLARFLPQDPEAAKGKK